MTTWSPIPGREISDENEPARPTRDGIEVLAVRSWQAAEAHLYPLAMVDPDLYEEAVTLVREAADVLRSCCADVTVLIDADPREVLDHCQSAPLWTERGLDPLTAFDAARAIRWRELGPERCCVSHVSNSGGPR